MRWLLIFLITTLMFITSCVEYVPHKRINFLSSFSPDVVYYKLYVSEAPEQVTVKSRSFNIDDGLNTGELDKLTSRMSIDLTELLDKGEYYIGVTTVGSNNEESEMRRVEHVIIIK